MRIAIDLQGAQSTGSRNRGIGRYSLSLAQAIARNRGKHEVIIVLNGQFPETIEEIRAAFEGILPQNNIRVWHATESLSHANPTNNWRRKTAELTREAFLTSLQPDIVHITSLFEGLVDNAITSIGQFSQTIPTAVTLYDLIPLINRKPYLENPTVESWYENKLDQIRRSALLLAISESSQQEGIKYLGFPPEKSINVGTAADSQFHKKDINKIQENRIRQHYGLFRSFVMYTGGIDHRKNIEGLIRSYALLPKSLRDKHQLAIVCSVQQESRLALTKLAQQHGLAQDEVILTGFVPEEDLIALYHLCQAFVFPSWHEGFGLPALEAMACGAPVIGANTSSLPEVIGLPDALFDPYDDKDIANKLLKVLTENTFRSKLIQHGLKQAKKFSWDESAKKAIAAFEKLHSSREDVHLDIIYPKKRKKIAYVSPLPPERSGIADYSAELMVELSRHYDIEVIIAQEKITTPWIKENCAIRDSQWLLDHPDDYDRVLYHFGNSPFHQHMFELVEKIPGVVVLHDFFLSGIVAHMDLHGHAPNKWAQALYEGHGYDALQERFHSRELADVIWKYPSSMMVFSNSKGVIVHSESSRRLARNWYGEVITKNCSVIPLLRAPCISQDRKTARQALNISDDIFVVCSFGMLGQNKLNHRLLNAWLTSSLSKDKHCLLIFVGENHNGEYGENLISSIRNSQHADSILITGWTDTIQYHQYLAAADVGVQLRGLSRGETSAAVLDCMNYGLATIVNANGSMADLRSDTVWMMPDEFNDTDLTHALETLWKNKNQRLTLGESAKQAIHELHSPRYCADQYFKTIESYYISESESKDSLIHAIGKITPQCTDEYEMLALAKSIAQNHQPVRKKQFLLDISVLVHSDAKSGIQRVVRSILSELLANPPEGFRVEPIYANPDGPYRYARRFTLSFLDCPDSGLHDDVIDVYNEDIYLCLDLTHHIAIGQADFFAYMRRIGVDVNFIVYDLLPILMPDFFPEGVSSLHTRWLEVLAKTDGALCISRAVADELYEWLGAYGPERQRPYNIGYFHLGADVVNSIPTTGLPDNARQVLDALAGHPTFLTVGTVEPRKGQLQVLKAFELLWNQGTDVNLVIVGKNGWNVDKLVEDLRNHPECNKRLFWLEGISDEYLEKVYTASTCLIAGSEGEGFGLPLIEGAQHKLPIIARDIPVFREVAGEHAFYFSGLEPISLADTITEWLKLDKIGGIPKSVNMPWLTWKQSTQHLIDIILGGKWYKKWMKDDAHRFWGSDNRLNTQVGQRLGRNMISTYSSGYLLFGPYISLPAGRYHIVVNGMIGKNGPAGAYLDIAIEKGEIILDKYIFDESNKDEQLASLFITLDQPCSDLEIRIWVSDTTNIQISLIEIQPQHGVENTSKDNQNSIIKIEPLDQDALNIEIYTEAHCPQINNNFQNIETLNNRLLPSNSKRSKIKRKKNR